MTRIVLGRMSLAPTTVALLSCVGVVAAVQVGLSFASLRRAALASEEIEGLRLDPNVASEYDLAVIPTIGPALAARIVADREKHGPFPTVASLDRVKGIGASTLNTISGHLKIGAPSLVNE